MSGNPLDSWTQEQINPDHFEHFLFFSYDTWMFFKMCKGISCLVSEPRYVTNMSFLSLGSVTVLPTDMVKKRCTGANPSAALDSMKAGTCVSVSSAFFFGFEVPYIHRCAGVNPLWWVTCGGCVTGAQFLVSDARTALVEPSWGCAYANDRMIGFQMS